MQEKKLPKETDQGEMECFSGMQDRKDHGKGRKQNTSTYAASKRLQVAVVTGHNLRASHASQMGINYDGTYRKCRDVVMRRRWNNASARYQIFIKLRKKC